MKVDIKLSLPDLVVLLRARRASGTLASLEGVAAYLLDRFVDSPLRHEHECTCEDRLQELRQETGVQACLASALTAIAATIITLKALAVEDVKYSLHRRLVFMACCLLSYTGQR